METQAKKKRTPGQGRHGKKYANALALLQTGKNYSIADAFEILPKVAYAKFDEAVDIAFTLGIDPKHADQMVRGALILPHGTGKTARIAVFAKGEKATDAKNAGADIVGAEDLVEKVMGGWLEFDKVIATPDMMVAISKLGKILGPRGLMPNPKLGQVTMDVVKAIQDQKRGKVEYKAEKAGIIQVAIGRKSFGAEKLRDNFKAVLSAVVKAKPPTSKGVYLRKVTVSTTMSPGIPLDTAELIVAADQA